MKVTFARIVGLLLGGALLIAALSAYNDRLADIKLLQQALDEAESDNVLFSRQLGECQAQLPR